MKYILKKQMSLYDSDFFLFTLDLEKYNNQLSRTELDEETFNKIVTYIERQVTNFKRRQFAKKRKKCD